MRYQGETLPAPIRRALQTCFRRVRAPWLRRAARPEPESWFGSGMMAVLNKQGGWDRGPHIVLGDELTTGECIARGFEDALAGRLRYVHERTFDDAPECESDNVVVLPVRRQ